MAYLERYLTSLEQSEVLEEIEYLFFLHLTDFDELVSKAKTVEHQEQWSVLFSKGPLETTIRARRSERNGEVSFTLTNKVHLPGIDGKWELEQQVKREHYDAIYEHADTGMIKTRYTFPIDGTDLVWEIDVFNDTEGNPVPWVKVDLEVKHRLAQLPEFPIHYSKAILSQPGERTAEEDALVSQLFKDHYLLTK